MTRKMKWDDRDIITQEEYEKVMEELLAEREEERKTENKNVDVSGIGRKDDAGAGGIDDGGASGVGEEIILDGAGKGAGSGLKDGKPITQSVRFFMAMEKVPTATAQEKDYRVLQNGYKYVNGVRKPQYKVLVFDKPGTAEAKEILMSALDQSLKKLGYDRHGVDRFTGEKLSEGGNVKSDDGVSEGGMNGITGEEAGRKTLFPAGVPLSLTVKWCFSSKEVMRKIKSGKMKDGTPRVTKPDTDNLQKMLKDCMTRLGFWGDDAQVCEEHVGKYWTAQPGIYVRIDVIR